MGNKTLDQVLDELGITAWAEKRGEERGEARAEKRKAISIAQNLIEMGLTNEQIAKATQLDLSTVESLMGGGIPPSVFTVTFRIFITASFTNLFTKNSEQARNSVSVMPFLYLILFALQILPCEAVLSPLFFFFPFWTILAL